MIASASRRAYIDYTFDRMYRVMSRRKDVALSGGESSMSQAAASLSAAEPRRLGEDGLAVVVGIGVLILALVSLYGPDLLGWAVTTSVWTDPSKALQLWTPPLYSENAATATLTQRGGADITLSSTSDTGLVTIAKGASVTVDPGRSITLASGGSVDVEGILTAHGGTISAASPTDLPPAPFRRRSEAT